MTVEFQIAIVMTTPSNLTSLTRQISGVDSISRSVFGLGRWKTISLVFPRLMIILLRSAQRLMESNSVTRSTSEASGTNRLVSSAYLV